MKTVSGLRRFEELECWKACRQLRLSVRKVVKDLPSSETYLLSDQLTRAARSTTANIAEGYGRFHYQETIQYLRHARGSCYEILDHMLTAEDEGFVVRQIVVEFRQQLETCVKLINGYIRYLTAKKREI